MPTKKKAAAKLTHPRLPGKKYVTQRGLNQALAALDKRENAETQEVSIALSPAAQEYLRDHPQGSPNEEFNATQESTAREIHKAPEYIRNRSHIPFSLRLERHDGKRRIELKPRGERGDLSPIKPEDLNDPTLINNINIGIIELISAGEAAEVATKQTTNQQKRHPALQALRNPLGDEYGDDALQVEIPFEQQGVVVAELTDGNVVVDRGGIQRKRAKGQEPGTPDYVVGAERTHAPAGEEAAYLSDLRARAKDIEGPAAAGIQRVTVAPTQKTTKGGIIDYGNTSES